MWPRHRSNTRNIAFTLYHALQTPKLEVQTITAKPLTATVTNQRVMPTHSTHDVKHKIKRPDYITLKGATVVAGLIVGNADLNLTREQRQNPFTLEVPTIPGMGYVTVR